MVSKEKILIIGAGPSGLVSAKEALDNGLEPIIFEKTPNIGGLWNPETGGVWPSMHTNLSKFTCSFTGFPWPDKAPMFPSSSEMYDYLLRYAENFNLRHRIQFGHTVISVSRKSADPGWLVSWLDDKEQTTKSDTFSGVIVCSGIFSGPYIPDIPGLSSFNGKQLHSKDYKGGSSFEGQTVLVVGGAISGEQVASDLSNYAKRVIHSFRKPFWLLNPYLPQNPADMDTPYLPLDFLFYNRTFYSRSQPKGPIEVEAQRRCHMSAYCKAQQLIPELCIDVKQFADPIHVTISEHYLGGVEKGTIFPKLGNIQELQGGKVIFKGGEECDIDAIIFSTGFKVNVPFLSEQILETLKFSQDDQFQPMILYNATLHPDLPGLFFVGMYKGPYFAVMELQARWSCRLLSGKLALPSNDKIAEGLQREVQIREYQPRGQFPHPDYVKFADEIAELAGSFPNLVKFKELSLAESLSPGTGHLIADLEKCKDEIYEKFMTTTVIPEHYNLFENPRSALAEIDKVIGVIKGYSVVKPNY